MKVDKEKVMEYLDENPNATLEDYGKVLGITRQAVFVRLKQRDLNWRDLKEEVLVNKIREFTSNRHKTSIREISEKLGVSTGVIGDLIEKYGIKINRKNLEKISRKKIRREEIEEYIHGKDKVTILELAKHFKVQYFTMCKFLELYNSEQPISGIDAKKMLTEGNVRNFLSNNPKSNLIETSKYFEVPTNILQNFLKKNKINIPNKWERHIYNLKISKEQITEYVNKNPDCNEADLCEYFDVPETTMRRALKKYNINLLGKNTNRKYRKNYISKRDLPKIIDMLDSIDNVTIDKLIDFLDRKGMKVSKEDILEYQKRVAKRNTETDGR